MGEAKNKKQRECPAKGGIISPDECGRGRNSVFTCPTDCVHNPFATANFASHYAPLEARVTENLSRKLGSELTPAQLRELADAIDQHDGFTCHALHVWHVHGEGRLTRWMADAFQRGWKNDEQVMLSHLASIRPALLEFREVRDDLSCVAVDLLHPESPPFVAIDPAAASRLGRFAVMLGWRHDLPNGQRISGELLELPLSPGQDPLASFHALLEQLGAPADDRDAWLMEHMPLLAEAFTAIEAARQEKRVTATDLQSFVLHHRIEPSAAATLPDLLREHPRLFHGAPQDGKALLRAGLLDESCDRDHDEHADMVAVLTVYPDHLEVEAIGEAKAAQARRFIASLGVALGPEECTIEDLAASLPKQEYDPELVPACFLENLEPLEPDSPVVLKDPAGPTLAWRYRNFAHTALPILKNRTPREAAADTTLRPQLVQLMKGHLRACDIERRTRGTDFDLNPLLGELGLDELILPPPPLGWLAEDETEDDAIPLDPPPPQALLDGEELSRRIELVTSDEALWNRLDIRLADVLDAFNDLSEKLNPHELEALQTTVLAALGALHIEQVPGYEPDPERMLARYEAWIRSGDDEEELADYVERIFEGSCQPRLCEAAADLLFVLEKECGKKFRAKRLDVILTALAAAVWEAAHWPPLPG
ncbi:MAG: hypothetical protein EAZ65_03080 [Verrucomicrobia bacterium]|nr:MAG: hypothetical protein EAZ84_02110 [Verrucomicrobiota bacterium]TAE88364.1 MAG: hypothetical protein EAZ82_03765 [Verrucomicrobiota bacterium]TAF26818.1 MAG: hypothetical protein EAZ71_03075 [Verrucomicrobiota bacterium]TAF42075.1 MAG: hypothetical protein EAZ65_03080 [Verrucomicrobiota bacterium]